MEVPVLAAVAAFLVVVLLVIVYLSIRVVQQYEKMVVFRLGRTNEKMVRDPGLRFLVPIIDRPVKVDVREQFIEVPSQTTITKDNAPISVDFLIYWRISDPLKSVVNVANFPGALQGVATTTLRAVIGDILLDEVLSKREQINEVLRTKLDEVTERWGGKVTTVEIREITPPRDVQDAMNRQLSAERTRRAVITESEGSRQAAINVAEGQKQSEILQGRGRPPGGDPAGRGLQRGADPDLQGGHRRRPEDDVAAVPRSAQGARGGPGHQVHHPDGVHPAARSVPGVPGARLRGIRNRGRARGVIRRGLLAVGGAIVSIASLDVLVRRAARRLLEAPRVLPEEAGLRPALDALGGEVVRVRARDGLRLSARWLEGEPATRTGRSIRTRRSCCSTAGRARSRRIWSSTGPSSGGRPPCSGSTSAVTANPTCRQRRSACARSRTSPARWPGSASGAWSGSPSSGCRWAGSRPSPRSPSSATGALPVRTSTRPHRPTSPQRGGPGSWRWWPIPRARTCLPWWRR